MFVGEISVGDDSAFVNFQVVRVLSWQRVPVMLGNQYGYTKHLITLQTFYNPAGMSYGQNFGQSPQAQFGLSGFQTDANLRAWLEQPRRRFRYSKGGVVVLDSHESIAPCDVAGGPFCKVHQIWSRGIGGSKTCNLNLTFEVSINESSRYTSSPSVVLAHVYKQSHSLDADAFVTIVTEGEVLFRRDRLELLQSRGDNYRDWFLAHPIGDDLQRISVKTMVDTTGTRVKYLVVDKERALNLLVAQYGVTRIEAAQTYSRRITGLEAGVPAFANIPYKFAKNAWDMYSPYGGNVGNLVSQIFMGEKGSMPVSPPPSGGDVTALAKYLPTIDNTVSVRVWGNRLSNKQGLLQVCLKVIDVVRIKLGSLGGALPNRNFFYGMDLAGKFVQASVTWLAGPGATSTAGNPSPEKIFLDNDEVPGILTALTAQNPVYPNDGGTRGSFVGGMVSQALSTPFAVPPAPLAVVPASASSQPP